jgi:hypothetical protein
MPPIVDEGICRHGATGRRPRPTPAFRVVGTVRSTADLPKTAEIYMLWCTTATITRYLGLNAAATGRFRCMHPLSTCTVRRSFRNSPTPHRATYACSYTKSDTTILDDTVLYMVTLTVTTILFTALRIHASRNISLRIHNNKSVSGPRLVGAVLWS